MTTQPKRRLYRSTDDRVLTGVCGGIAEYFGIDATLVRVVTVVLTIASIGLPVPLIYLILAIVTPRDEGGNDLVESRSIPSAPAIGAPDRELSAKDVKDWELKQGAASLEKSAGNEG
jgi:phage shock protein C